MRMSSALVGGNAADDEQEGNELKDLAIKPQMCAMRGEDSTRTLPSHVAIKHATAYLLLRRALGQDVAVPQVVDFDVFDVPASGQNQQA